MKSVVLGCVAGLLLALSSSQVAAQPLAEIARREKLRREALAAKAAAEGVSPKVYTNADLRGAGRLTTSNVETQPPATTETATAAAPPTENAPETAGAPTDEEQWRSRRPPERRPTKSSGGAGSTRFGWRGSGRS